jgi:hypothetical protein
LRVCAKWVNVRLQRTECAGSRNGFRFRFEYRRADVPMTVCRAHGIDGSIGRGGGGWGDAGEAWDGDGGEEEEIDAMIFIYLFI